MNNTNIGVIKMNTTIYLIRHSEPTKIINHLVNNDSLQVKNEKNILSFNGEKRAEKLSLNTEMQNVDVVITSNYVRTIATAKYIAENNNTDINIIENFGERKFGINNWNELPKDFEKKQLENPNFKVNNGESQQEVSERMYKALIEVLNKYKGKKIVIVSHSTAITFLFMKLCIYKDNCIYFNNKKLIDSNFQWNAPEVFKLNFFDNDLQNIENIKIDY